jgi:hypothetical protein
MEIKLKYSLFFTRAEILHIGISAAIFSRKLINVKGLNNKKGRHPEIPETCAQDLYHILRTPQCDTLFYFS